jgi:hypothetical protein
LASKAIVYARNSHTPGSRVLENHRSAGADLQVGKVVLAAVEIGEVLWSSDLMAPNPPSTPDIIPPRPANTSAKEKVAEEGLEPPTRGL